MVADNNKHVRPNWSRPKQASKEGPRTQSNNLKNKEGSSRHFNQYVMLTGLRCSKGAITYACH